jgi:hypothetical protein
VIRRAIAPPPTIAITAAPTSNIVARDDVTGELEARHVGRCTGRRRIRTFALMNVGAIEPRRCDLDLDFARAGIAHVELAELDHLGTAGAAKADRRNRGAHYSNQ